MRALLATLAVIPLALAPTARAADPTPYTVALKPTGNADLDAALTDTSNLVSLREASPAGPFSLILRARQDIDRLDTALRGLGHYRARLAIRIAGQPLDKEDLAEILTRAPTDPPVPVEIAVDTGPRFSIGAVRLNGSVPPDMAARLTLVPGAPATSAGVIAARDQLLSMLRDAGYALAKVELLPAELRPSESLLDVTFSVATGPVVEIGAIRFSGQTQVNEDFVRRRVRLRSGERFNPAAVEAARADLAALGVFGSVRADPADHLDTDGRLPLTFYMTERPRHAVNADIAYSTDLGVTLGGGWRHRNLFGNAEQLNLTGSLQPGGNAIVKPGYMVGAEFVKPEFLAHDQSLTLGVGAIKRSLQAYDQEALTQKAILTRVLTPRWTLSFGLTGEQERIYQEGVSRQYNLIGAPLQLKYDSTQSLFDPTSGIRASWLLTPTYVVGGRDPVFVTAQVSGSAYFDLVGNGRSVLAIRGLAGEIFGTASAFGLPPDQRFYAGGSATVRGYRYQSIGPRFASGRPTGGTGVSAGTLEFRQRIGENFGAAGFIDAGQISASGAPFTSNWHAGAGAGLRYYTSIGPIRLDVAVPLNRSPGGDSFELYIGIGHAF